MRANKGKVILALVLAFIVAWMPLFAYANDDEVKGAGAGDSQEEEQPLVTDFGTFISDLKVLEGYATSYANGHNGENATELVINFVRTGVNRYNTGTWNILAGEEKTAFVNYVVAQDAANGTHAMDLRSLGEFEAPNGQKMAFDHVFGTMNITLYMARKNPTEALTYADMGGWAGDLVDLYAYVCQHRYEEVSGQDIDTMTDTIRTAILGYDDPEYSSFGIDDIRGDLDVLYIMNGINSGKKLSSVMSSYYSTYLTDKARAKSFIKLRFGSAETKADLRRVIENAYNSNNMIPTLEEEHGLGNADTDARVASCRAFADYLFELTGGVSEKESNELYSVFSSKESTIAPGVTQQIKTATTADNKQLVYYIATADISREDVMVQANYKDNQGAAWGMQRVQDQMEAAKANHDDPSDERYIPNYNPVVGVNADLFNMVTGKPTGALVMEGTEYNPAGNEGFFAILKDGSATFGTSGQYNSMKNQIQEAVGVNAVLVRNGELAVKATANYYNNRASRTAVGITADGKVVLMVMDGRQEPVSVGGSAVEIAQVMLDAGCVEAYNLDGGGSTTFIAREEGEEGLSVVNTPSDGFARSVSSSLMIVSTARPSDEFDHALVVTDYDYLTVGTTQEVTVTGVSASGGAAELPEGTELVVSDNSIGKIEGTTFTALSEGTVKIQAVWEGQVFGEKTLNVVTPTTIAFSKSNINAIYEKPLKLPVVVSYNGNPVATNQADVLCGYIQDGAPVTEGDVATVTGTTFVGHEASGVRSVNVGAVLIINGQPDMSKYALAKVNLFSENEAVFDFDNATSGDRSLAYTREVSNSSTSDEHIYYAVDVSKPMDTTYTFALDMTTIPIPEQMASFVSLLPGGDNVDATAWSFLLQLAERVSVLTEVKIELQVDPNLSIDASQLQVVNEYFELKSATVDEETNTLTILCNWLDQTQAIEPDTANPMCILSGIKLTPKDDAAWDANTQLSIVNKGSIAYDIFLRASFLAGLSEDSDLYKIGVRPYTATDVMYNGAPERGGHFASDFASIEDSYVLDASSRQGWVMDGDGDYRYFVDNEMLTGVQKLPDYNGEGEYYFDLGDNGISQGKISGLFNYDGGLYFGKNGVPQGGWQTVVRSEGDADYYFFNTWSKRALNGEQTINGYHYLFEDYKLVRGDLVTQPNGQIWYMWAGSWTSQKWVTIDGNKYYFRSSYAAATGIYGFNIAGVNKYYVFGDDGVWQEDLNGFYTADNGRTYLVEAGIVNAYPGLVYYDGDFYYFTYDSIGYMVKGGTYWVDKTNGLLPQGNYKFDADGKMIDVPTATVTWKNWDETTLATETVSYGATPEYKGDTPARPSDQEGAYEFTGWNPEVVAASGDATYTAQFERVPITYTVTWLDEDGTELQVTEVEQGKTPQFTGEAPKKPSTAQYSYEFAGWTPEVTEATEDVTYTATYTEAPRQYTITWLSDDESLIDATSVAYGQVPEHEAPNKEGDARFTYEFMGWNPEPVAVTGDAIYQASFKSIPVMYTVTWLNDDGTLLKEDSVAYGVTPEYGADVPVKASDGQHVYTFAGWDHEVAPVTSDVTYTATYSSKAQTYTVTWVDDKGATLEIDEDVECGVIPSYDGEEPTKEGDAQHSYTFVGWTPELTEVVGNTTYQAVFESTVNAYTITWYDEDGKTALETDESVEYGTIPSYDGEEPSKAADDYQTYVFAGWDPEPVAVEADASYKAVYTPTDRLYLVIWQDDDGTELARLSDVTLASVPAYEGGTPTKEAPAGSSYTFTGWSKSVDVENQIVWLTATYEYSVTQYTVKWLNDDGSELKTEQVPFGETPVYAGAEPTKADDELHTYSFSGWTPEVVPVAGDATYTATYEAKPRTYTVQWLNADGTLLETDEGLAYGDMPSYDSSEPTLAGDGTLAYAFKGWSPEISEVTGDATYTAAYSRTGWVTDENGTTYLIDDEIAHKNEIVKIGDETYLFDADGYLAKGYGLKRVINGDEINYYYFDQDGKAVRNVPEGGQDFWVSKTNGLPLPVWGYYFDENGVILHDPDTSRVGIFEDEAGKLFYYIDGVKVHMGMIKVDDDYYYVRGSGELVVGCSYWCTDVNSTGLEEGTYTFDGQGRMVVEQPDDRTGIFEEDGSLWYYEHGRRTYAGLIEVDGSYYYVRTSGEVVHGQRYWTTKTNDLMPEASYEFDEDGRMVTSQAEPKNGFYEEDGSLWYYVDGAKSYAGLIEVDGSYYYVRTSGEAVRGRSYWISKTNDLMTEGSYTFDEDGRMVVPQEPDPSEAKQGIVSEDGSLWWYVDGKRTYAGVFELDGSYYYAKTNGEVVHGRRYWISKTNGLLPEASYEFAEDGKLIQ